MSSVKNSAVCFLYTYWSLDTERMIISIQFINALWWSIAYNFVRIQIFQLMPSCFSNAFLSIIKLCELFYLKPYCFQINALSSWSLYVIQTVWIISVEILLTLEPMLYIHVAFCQSYSMKYFSWNLLGFQIDALPSWCLSFNQALWIISVQALLILTSMLYHHDVFLSNSENCFS